MNGVHDLGGVHGFGPDECWLSAFERALFEKFAVSDEEIDTRANALAEGDEHPHSH